MRELRRIGLALFGAAVILLDVMTVAALVSVGSTGVRAMGGGGLVIVGVVLAVVAAANLLLAIGLVYPRAVRRAELSSERSS
ncbi:MAG TPA: hypothetical protein VFT45_23560 [Longimicrobium sp.]|nr:hypothetical protein [Longimicrobium sp.]